MHALRFLLCFFQDCLELLYLFFGGSPGGDEAADGVVVVGLTEMGEGDTLGQALGNGIGEYNELLIGGRIDIEGIAVLTEQRLHLHGHRNGMLRELEIKGRTFIIDRGEKGLELQADKSTLGNDGTMLLLNGEEMLMGRTIGEDDGLATEGAYLGASDIEDIAMTGKEGKGDVALRGHEAVAKAGSVDVEGEVVALADGIEVGELAGAVEGAVLGGEGDIDEAGVDAVVAIAVVLIVIEVTVEDCCL